MGFSGNDPRVGVIDGEKINYSEYLQPVRRQVKSRRAATSGELRPNSSPAMLANADVAGA